MQTANRVPLSLYVHVPWCVQKCPYCDFNSHSFKTSFPEQSYIDRLIQDLRNDLSLFQEKRELHSIFIGGGTPSLFSDDSITRLLASIEKEIPFSHNIEITLEANPGTVDSAHFKGYLTAGVNRLSIGIQSFQPLQLSQLGRIHSPEQAKSAVYLAQDIGFKQINVDIMFGLPLQTQSQAINDIEQAIDLNTPHLSYYQLTLEPGTLFHKHPPKTPSEQHIDDRYLIAIEKLKSAGFEHYETSAWTKQKNYCRHNLNYWQYGDYLGIGAGAHGKITQISEKISNKTLDLDAQIIRTTKPKSPKGYLSCELSSLCEQRIVKEEEKAFEFMLNTLRLHQGFNLSWIKTRGLFDDKKINNQILKLKQKGLIHVTSEHIKPTQMGQRFLNDMLNEFLN